MKIDANRSVIDIHSPVVDLDQAMQRGRGEVGNAGDASNVADRTPNRSEESRAQVAKTVPIFVPGRLNIHGFRYLGGDQAGPDDPFDIIEQTGILEVIP